MINDTENGVIMLKAVGDQPGTAHVTIRVDTDGLVDEQTVEITIVQDTVNTQPFLNPIPPIGAVSASEPFHVQLSSSDAENDVVEYGFVSMDATASIDQGSGVVTITPNAGFVGALRGTFSVRQPSGLTSSSGQVDTQIVDIEVVPVGDELPANAVVGKRFIADLNAFGERAGLTYELIASPAGMIIDPQSGIVQWTPSANQLGARTFTVAFQNPGSSTLEQSFEVLVSQDPSASLDLDVTDMSGNPISSVFVGETYVLTFNVQDLRTSTGNNSGVFAAYADVTFNSSLAAVTGDITFQAPYTLASSGVAEPGLIDELGAVNMLQTPAGSEELRLATVAMTATSRGTLAFTLNPADFEGNDILLSGANDVIPASQIFFGNALLNVRQRLYWQGDGTTVNWSATLKTGTRGKTGRAKAKLPQRGDTLVFFDSTTVGLASFSSNNDIIGCPTFVAGTFATRVRTID
ncbi:MAG: putative Ig domain-containing protein [Pirellulaceae bacterium]